MAETKKNRSIFTTESEFNTVKQLLDLIRSGKLTISTDTESITESKNEAFNESNKLITRIDNFLEELRPYSRELINQNEKIIRTGLTLYFYEQHKREKPGWDKGDVYSFAAWCNKQDPNIELEVNKILNAVNTNINTNNKTNPFTKLNKNK